MSRRPSATAVIPSNRRSSPNTAVASDSPEPDSASQATDSDTSSSSLKRSAAESLSDDLTKTGRAKKKKSDPFEIYIKAGRWIPRNIDPFVNINLAFSIGIQLEIDEEDEDATPPTEDDKHHASVYKLILALVPGFSQRINKLSDKSELNELVRVIATAAGDSRSDDTGSLKHVGLEYVLADPKNDTLLPKIPRSNSKAIRGFNHPVLMRLLCPRRLIDELEADETLFKVKVADGRIKVTAQDWPAFLYDDSPYDPDDIEYGLFRGRFLLRVYRHIFTGPTSALKPTPGSASTRACVAKINGLVRVTPRSIAYAAIQARFILTTTDSWATDDGIFNMKTFYDAIVQAFELDPDDEWCLSTLAWWNENVFGIKPTTNDDTATNEPASNEANDSDITRMLAKRAAKRAARLAAASAATTSTATAANSGASPSATDARATE